MLTYEYKYFPKDRHMTTVRTDELKFSGSTASSDLDAYLREEERLRAALRKISGIRVFDLLFHFC